MHLDQAGAAFQNRGRRLRKKDSGDDVLNRRLYRSSPGVGEAGRRSQHQYDIIPSNTLGKCSFSSHLCHADIEVLGYYSIWDLAPIYLFLCFFSS